MEPCNEFAVKDYFLRLLYESVRVAPMEYVVAMRDLDRIKTTEYQLLPWLKGRVMYWVFAQYNNHYYSVLIDKSALTRDFGAVQYNKVQMFKFKMKYPSFLKDRYILEGFCTLPFHFHLYTIHSGRDFTANQSAYPAFMSHLAPLPSLLEYVADMPNNSNGVIFFAKDMFYTYAVLPSTQYDKGDAMQTQEVTLYVKAHLEFPDVYYLHCEEKGEVAPMEHLAFVESMDKSLYLQKLFAQCKEFIMRATYNFRFRRWMLVAPVDVPLHAHELSSRATVEQIENSIF